MDINLFKNKIKKQNILIVDGINYTDSNLVGGVNYEQTVNSGTDIVLGSCTVATIEFELMNLNNLINNLAGKEITWKIRVETSPGVFEEIQMGIFIAEKPTKINDTRMKVKAYDRMIKFDVIIDEWLNGLTYPRTLASLLSGLCTYVGVTLATTTFLNDNFSVKDNFRGVNVTGRQYLKYIAEVAGKYATINNLGQLKLAWYNTVIYNVTNADYYSVKVEDYSVNKIDKLQVRVEENDIGVIVGTGNNTYIIQNNPLLYAGTDAEIRPYVENIYNSIKNITYIPFEIKVNANPMLQAGNMINITTRKGQVFTGVIMSRKMTNGSDVYKATGNVNRSVNTSLNSSILQIRGKTNVLERTIDETVSKLYDAETGDISILTQTVNGFSSRIQSLEANTSYRYVQDTAPINPEIGDTWFSTSNEVFIVDNLLMTVDEMLNQVDYYHNSLNRTYRWNGSIWEHVEDGAISELRLNVSEIEQLVDLIGLSVQAYDGRIGSLEVTASSITSRVSDAEDNIGSLELTATNLTTRIQDAEGNIGTLQLAANSLTARIEDAEGDIGTLQLTAESLTSRFEDIEGNVATLTLNTSSLSVAINNTKVVINSTDGVVIKNGGIHIRDDNNNELLTLTSNKIQLIGEIFNGTTSTGVKITNGELSFYAANSGWLPTNWGQYTGNIKGYYEQGFGSAVPYVYRINIQGKNSVRILVETYSDIYYELVAQNSSAKYHKFVGSIWFLGKVFSNVKQGTSLTSSDYVMVGN